MTGKIFELVSLLLWLCIRVSYGQYCGVQSIKPKLESRQRVIGGQTPIPHSWPWAVALISGENYEEANLSGSFGCSATLINPNNRAFDSDIILTAAHCVAGSTAEKLFIYLGGIDWNKRSENTNSVLSPVREIISHPKYVEDNGQVGYDIALIKLSSPVSFNEYIQPACLPDSTLWTISDNNDCYAVGYGAMTDVNKQYGVLQQLFMPVHPNMTSSEQTYLGIGPDRIYAKNPASNTGICYGDSGSGLYCYGDDKWSVVGDLAHFSNWSMVFEGSQALCEGNGAVYASAINALDWILTNSYDSSNYYYYY